MPGMARCGGNLWSMLVHRSPSATLHGDRASPETSLSPSHKAAYLTRDQGRRSAEASQSGALAASSPHSNGKTLNASGGRDQSFFWPVFGGSSLHISGILIPYYICPILPNFPKSSFYSDGAFEPGAVEGPSARVALTSPRKQSVAFEAVDDLPMQFESGRNVVSSRCRSRADLALGPAEATRSESRSVILGRENEIRASRCENKPAFGAETDLPSCESALAAEEGSCRGFPSACNQVSADPVSERPVDSALRLSSSWACREIDCLTSKGGSAPSLRARPRSLSHLFHSRVPRRVQYLLQWSIPNFLVLFIFACVLPACLKYRAPIHIDFGLLVLFLASLQGFVALKSHEEGSKPASRGSAGRESARRASVVRAKPAKEPEDKKASLESDTARDDVCGTAQEPSKQGVAGETLANSLSRLMPQDMLFQMPAATSILGNDGKQRREENGGALSLSLPSNVSVAQCAPEEGCTTRSLADALPACAEAESEARATLKEGNGVDNFQASSSLSKQEEADGAAGKVERCSNALGEPEEEEQGGAVEQSCRKTEIDADTLAVPQGHALVSSEEEGQEDGGGAGHHLPTIFERSETPTEDEDAETLEADAASVDRTDSVEFAAPVACAPSSPISVSPSVSREVDAALLVSGPSPQSQDSEAKGESGKEMEDEAEQREDEPVAEERETKLISDLASSFWGSPLSRASNTRGGGKKAVSFSALLTEDVSKAQVAEQTGETEQPGTPQISEQTGNVSGEAAHEPDFGDGLQRSHRAALSPALALLYDDDAVSVSEEILSLPSPPPCAVGCERSRPLATSLDFPPRGQAFIAEDLREAPREQEDETDEDEIAAKAMATPMHIGVDVDEGGIAANVKSFRSHASLSTSFLLESEDERSDAASGVCPEKLETGEDRPQIHSLVGRLHLPLAALAEDAEFLNQEGEDGDKLLTWKAEDTRNTTADGVCAFSSVSSDTSLLRSQSPCTHGVVPSMVAPGFSGPRASFPLIAESPFPFAGASTASREPGLAFGVEPIERVPRLEGQVGDRCSAGSPGIWGFPSWQSEASSDPNFPFGNLPESLALSPAASLAAAVALGAFEPSRSPAGISVETLLDLDGVEANPRRSVREEPRECKKALSEEECSETDSVFVRGAPFFPESRPAGPPPFGPMHVSPAENGNLRLASQRPSSSPPRPPPPPVSPARSPCPSAQQDEETAPVPVSAAPANNAKQRVALQHYMALVRECHRTRDSRGAIRVLERLQAEGRVAADTQLLNYVLMVCVSANDRVMTGQLFTFMETTGCADLVTYNTLVKSFTGNGELHAAEQVLARMEGRENTLEDELSAAYVSLGIESQSEKGVLKNRPRISPDEVTFNLLVNAAVSAGDPDKAWEYIDRIKKANLRPDKFTISSIIKSLQPAQNQQHTRRAFELMDQIDACEDLVLLSTCIDACARLGDLDRLGALLSRFEKSDLQPNAHAYGTLIKAYGKLGNVARVWELWTEQQRSGVEASNYTLGCMIDCLASNGLMAEAVDLFDKSVAAGSADAVLFSILVKGLARFRNRGVEVALGAYRRLKESDAVPGAAKARGNPSPSRLGGVAEARESRRRGDKRLGNEKGGAVRAPADEDQTCYMKALNTISFNSLLHLCVRSGRLADALELFKDMQSHPHAQPDLITYSTVIKGLCCSSKEHALDAALGLFEQMQKDAKISPDAIVYNTLIQGAATRRNVTLVESLLLHMLQNNVKPSSYTLCQCVKLYGKCGDLARALELALELPRRFNFAMDSYVYTALIAACTHNRAPFLAATLALQATQENQELPPALLLRLANHLQQQRDLAEREAMNSSLRNLPLLKNLCLSEPTGKALGLFGRSLSPADEAKTTVDAIIRLLKRAVGAVGCAPGAKERGDEFASLVHTPFPGEGQKEAVPGGFPNGRNAGAANSKRSKRGTAPPPADRERGERSEKQGVFGTTKRKAGRGQESCEDDVYGVTAHVNVRGFVRQGSDNSHKGYPPQRRQPGNAGPPPAYGKGPAHAPRAGGMPRGGGGFERGVSWQANQVEADVPLNFGCDGKRHVQAKHGNGASSSAITAVGISKEAAKGGRKGPSGGRGAGRNSGRAFDGRTTGLPDKAENVCKEKDFRSRMGHVCLHSHASL
ncbi:putative PPR repeat-containing protein [Neospora caninum Liverpool]|uniref:PPR repeat-containing protein, putative n=1 Tax=Neospora caninum (strain Liverpool) TaxID=572307 RepID=F0VR57_NEOCL|nr:putative PPR repeat-containing protein [Neospora caninum Liverpool]CBZ56205.1 putative PPR repeat-containing protein [Neospora caninum Liverpool]CEL70967.1 TPA: PPR repeat-containing protein, putative [Neospora caninum Liverpool]|eukprot:XP_003886230.1 putative PPR repeat-containing protein [Neospora caninum Liverpool]